MMQIYTMKALILLILHLFLSTKKVVKNVAFFLHVSWKNQ